MNHDRANLQKSLRHISQLLRGKGRVEANNFMQTMRIKYPGLDPDKLPETEKEGNDHGK